MHQTDRSDMSGWYEVSVPARGARCIHKEYSLDDARKKVSVPARGARCIFPENKEEVLNDLQQFQSPRGVRDASKWIK